MEIIIHCSVFIAILAAFPVFCSDILDNATLVEPMPEQESPPIVTMSKYEGHFKESYSGKPEENLELFLARFELNSQLRDFADAKKHLALNLRLKGNASIWVSTLPDGQKDTYEHLKAALIEHFQGNDMKWVNESKLSSRIQTEAESLDDYFSDILTLCHRLGKSEQEKLTHFICGLKPNLRAFVISKEPESIDKAVHFARLAQTVTNLPSTPSVNLQEQRKDSFAAKMIRYLEIGDLPDDNKEARNILLESEHYFLHEGGLFHIWSTPAKRHFPERTTVQLYVPYSYIDTILNAHHDQALAAHFGFHKTYASIRKRYFWRGMYKDIDNWIRSCVSCASRKTPKHKVIAPLMTMEVPGPFERVSVDILGPLPISTSGSRYVLCFTDHCTRWPILVPIKNMDASTVAHCFYKEVICNHGCPRFLLSDRGTNFLSKLMLEVCRIMTTNKLNTSSYHPQCNAVQERFNAVILDTISHYVNKFQTDWDDYLPSIQFAYRTSSTDNSVGFSPFFLLYGREAILPMDVALLEPERLTDRTVREHIKQLVTQLETTREISKHHLQQNQQTMKKRYDQHATDVQYQVGDSVFIYFPVTQPGLSKKLCKHWCGPYLIIKQSSPVNFMVRNLENNKLLKAPIHANRMKFAYNRYVRPANNELPVDLQAQAPVAVLDDTDLPKDSFEPLLAKQTVKDSVILPVPGLPAHKKQTDKLYAVEKVIRGKFVNGKLHYLIKWQNFSSKSNSWEPEDHLTDATLDSLKTNPVRIAGKVK
ncbi:uncharacterized protein [Amphiura filiformis]|uniref:uncharacterized protein isoform X1 n=1 Tax=Amphiura filiformis TaxID=82378 RepID=UPI003B22845F